MKYCFHIAAICRTLFTLFTHFPSARIMDTAIMKLHEGNRKVYAPISFVFHRGSYKTRKYARNTMSAVRTVIFISTLLFSFTSANMADHCIPASGYLMRPYSEEHLPCIVSKYGNDQGCQRGDRGKQRHSVQKRFDMLFRILIVFLLRQK